MYMYSCIRLSCGTTLAGAISKSNIRTVIPTILGDWLVLGMGHRIVEIVYRIVSNRIVSNRGRYLAHDMHHDIPKVINLGWQAADRLFSSSIPTGTFVLVKILVPAP